ncbi:MAG TPA: D-alanine--D-alanine ligase, partial [Desulfatiglandales bacterium]|nr:D-alanine--D-alanine ligase [Desulfatiglandales bacterium]
MSKLKVALIAGGWSQEREISLKSGESVFNSLDKDKYEVTRYDPSIDLIKLIKESKDNDIALIFLHGKKGEDGAIQGLFDILDLPYVGSGVLASALAMNKALSKKLFRHAGMNVPRGISVFRDQDIDPDGIVSSLGTPVVIKPLDEGSSIGLKICSGKAEIVKAIENAFAFNPEVIVEEYIKGREVSCAVLGNREPEALPVIEIIPQKKYGFFSYTAKYVPGASEEVCPAQLPEDIYKRIQDYAVKAHCALGCR